MERSDMLKYTLGIETWAIDVSRKKDCLNTIKWTCRFSPVFITRKLNVSKFYTFFYLFAITCRRNSIFSTRFCDMSKNV